MLDSDNEKRDIISEQEIEGLNNQIKENYDHHSDLEDRWMKPENPLLLEQLEWFRDQKLGLLIHWGPYSQLGIDSSWGLSDEDASWSRNEIDWVNDGDEFKREYFGLKKSFNPIRFQPEKWADLAADSGFKYFIFTTKHHDGFCMWDSHTTENKITDSNCLFHNHKYADVCKHVWDAFRSKGLAVAAYFSKADWHTPYYWAPGMERGSTMWRGPSYDPQKYPALWEKFAKLTHDQIMELVSNYGHIDILWLDAGWVSAKNGQDIHLGEIIEEARKLQPWLITADRTVGGQYENYLTPEQTIPPEPINVPWESCLTIGNSWTFRYNDTYKPSRQLIRIIIDIISKGGNVVFGIGPQPDGRIPEGAVLRLHELGEWLKIYGEAVYGTRTCAPYRQGNCYFTMKKDIVYCFYTYDSEDPIIDECIFIPYREKIKRIDLVGGNAELVFEHLAEGLRVNLSINKLTEINPVAHVLRMYRDAVSAE